MRAILLLFLSASALPLLAQKEANVWHFGSGRSIDFNFGAPILLTGSAMQTFEGSSSVCDSAGNLLFYTNGGGREPLASGQDPGHIWNRDNAVMYDMQGIEGGGFSSAQSSVIFRSPGQEDRYHVFTMDELEHYVGASPAIAAAQPVGRGLSYFTVDMKLNGGLGGVVQADQRVFTPSYEGLCAIRHANKEDYWILIHRDTLGLGVYSVTASGVALASVFNTPQPTGGTIKASPDGKRVHLENTTFLFNHATGQLSDPQTWSDTIEAFEFSPNGKYLYRIKRKDGFSYTVDRYNVNIPAGVEETLFTSPSFESPGQMQLGPDGRIYFLSLNLTLDTVWLNRINCPNTSASSVEHRLFAFPVNDPTEFFLGLPNFPAWIFENKDSLFVALGPDTLCYDGAPILLDAQNPGATYQWSTGAVTRSITVTQPGLFTVTVTGPCGSGTDSIRVLECLTKAQTCTVLEYTGTIQPWTVPAGVETIRVKMWGAAGGAGPDTAASGGVGGGGGFTEATIQVTPGQTLEIFVGGGGGVAKGHVGGVGGWPNGGAGGSGNRVELNSNVGGAGGGGGRSEIRSGNLTYAIAGGGGGGSYGRRGGGGGGLEAEFSAANNQFQVNGAGGTQSAGGEPAANTLCGNPVSGTAGSFRQGGTGATDLAAGGGRTAGGGGGDGHYGGGGGSSHDGCFGVGSTGGGGSGTLCTTCPGVSGNTQSPSVFANGKPANDADPLLAQYPGTGTSVTKIDGGHGLVQICYDTPECIPSITDLAISSCDSYTAPWGTLYDQSGVYVDTFTNSAGCDSIVTLDLKLSTATLTDLAVDLCEGDSYPFGGSLMTEPGTYIDTLVGTGGCDSVLNLRLSRVLPFLDEESATACDSFLWDISGLTYLQAGTYEVALQGQNGCDSVYRLTLDLESSIRLEEAVSAIDRYTWPVNGITYTSGGVQTARFTGVNGCDSIRILNLSIEERIDLYFPNAFSPNGDGINDRFSVFGPTDVARVALLRIYDRWGGLLAELNDFPPGDPGFGWDGRSREGKPLNPDVFLYTARLTLTSGKSIDFSGEVILVR